MTFQPRDTEQVLDDLESNLKGKIERLSNFTRRSFNFVFARAYAREIRRAEVRNLASELSGFIEYSGGPVTQNDLDNLGVTGVEPSEVNEFMSDEFLDEYVKIVGIRRFEGTRASGSVRISTQVSRTVIPEGTVVTTSANDTGSIRSFETVSDTVVEDGVTVVQDVSVQAVEPGEQSNVPANTIVRFESPPVGVQGVTNPSATTGGEERESNAELRERAQNAVRSASEGGTTDGIKGFIRKNIEGVGEDDIAIDENLSAQPTTVDVVVDGGIRGDVIGAIETSRPTGIKHELVRPETVQIGMNTFLSTDSIVDTDRVTDTVETFLLDKGINENFFEDELIREIMTADTRIQNIESLGAFIERVTNEEFIFKSGQDKYVLRFTYDDLNGDIRIIDDSGTEYVEGTDFTVNDITGDGFPDTIVWLTGSTTSSTPSDNERFTVDYDVTVQRDSIEDEEITFTDGKSEYELEYSADTSDPVEIVDENDTIYEQGTDFTIIDGNNDTFADTVNWQTGSSDTSIPSDDTVFFVTYTLSSNSKTDINNFRLTSEVRDERFNWNLDFTESEDYESNQDVYQLTHVPFPDSVDTITTSNTTFTKGTDFDLVDGTGNGFRQSVDWSIGGSEPVDNEVFSITYDQKVYLTDNDVVESVDEIIRDETGDLYDEGNDFSVVSYNLTTNEDDAIEWNNKPSGLSDGELFFFSYVSEGDISISNREKISAGSIDIEVV
jgi:hypothetical protein